MIENLNSWGPLLVLLSSLVTGLLIFPLAEERIRLRTWLNLAGAVIKLVIVSIMLYGVSQEAEYIFKWPLFADFVLVLHADALAMLFVSLSTVLWLVTTIYAIGYLEKGLHRSRFFGFFSLCVASTMGISMAGNLFTFLVFYELLTLSTYPLVIHRGTKEALRGGQVYLIYTIGGGSALLLGVVWLYALVGNQPFVEGGYLHELADSHQASLTIIFGLLMIGFGVKAALVPLHSWLPQAMVAPAPVSALLHAVAVVKAGAFGIVRVVYDVYGIHFAQSTGLLTVLIVLACITIIYGSIKALLQDDLKRRLAYSTVSQVSYIALGVSLFGPLGITGGIVHLVHQGVMKITLFFCAGNYAEKLHIHNVSKMSGVGRFMPWTTLAFSVAALGMIGLPPLAGFISKWYLGLAALEAGFNWVLAVLVISSILNAMYFLPILYRAWFLSPEKSLEDKYKPGDDATSSLLWPPLITALLTLLIGLLAYSPVSPLQWAVLIAKREYFQTFD